MPSSWAASSSVGPSTSLHHDRANPIRLFEAVDLRDVRMIQRGEDLRFAAEAGQAFGVVGDTGEEHLDGDVALELGVARAVHLAHSTAPDEGQDFVRAESSAGSQGHSCKRTAASYRSEKDGRVRINRG